MKIYKTGKVAVVLQGRFAGRKAVVLKSFEEGTKQRPYPHAVVAGIERYPLKVNRRMSLHKVKLRSKIKAFVKCINYNHLMPTRYSLENNVIEGVPAAFGHKDRSKKVHAVKMIRKRFQKRYLSGNNKWFFSKLRF